MYVPPDEQIPEKLSQASAQRCAKAAERRRGEFLRGPIPLSWLKAAACLPGKALAVALAIWFAKGARKAVKVKVTPELLSRFGVGRKSSYRALDALEDVGLIDADRKVGRCPRVQIKTESEDVD